MKKYITNIEEETLENDNFRKVLFTAKHMQLVVMSLNPNEDIGEEVHESHDQFIRIEQGNAKAILDGEEFELEDDSIVVIPAGVRHNIVNTSSQNKVKLYTIYAPPEHKDKTIHKTKEEGMEHDDFDGITSF
ncbi:MAG: cupin domain-containing protein [Candidatus Pacebacteria bacterium]|jgi:mannose-6-phosphate isomerase-like protein (cupin superfamily)|nr:cupin domain-containing protein [Candidatus Paceibacterota bacterium]MDD2796519.1 cupin domain-containing protein [Candidatus Paceibacterota bacterium]MDD3047946.1 cupin domain-containing protein [Candidatus Paceibacterota bacterium]MDD3510101.1 cupin domain-containing protein [Candidatus Paceibacterota bacterium]MDD3918480.1 cupin domain-containing protein [Candidatus Paceibacterota bacterium]